MRPVVFLDVAFKSSKGAQVLFAAFWETAANSLGILPAFVSIPSPRITCKTYVPTSWSLWTQWVTWLKRHWRLSLRETQVNPVHKHEHAQGAPPAPAPVPVSLDSNLPMPGPQVFELPVNAFILEFVSDA